MIESSWKSHMNLVEKQITNKIVLDAGSGIGYNAYYLSSKAKKIICIEIKKNNLKLSREKYQTNNTTYILGNVELLPFINNYFDVVYSIWVIEHLEYPKQFIDEAYRVLKKNGKLIILTPNINNLQGCISKIIQYEFQVKILNKLLKKEMNYFHHKTFHRANTVKVLDKLCIEKFKRIHLERLDDSELFEKSKFLYLLWEIKHWCINNRFLNWLSSSFYVEYGKI